MAFRFADISSKELFYLRKKVFSIPFYHSPLHFLNYPLEVSSKIQLEYKANTRLIRFESDYGFFEYELPENFKVECFSRQHFSKFLPSSDDFIFSDNFLLFIHTKRFDVSSLVAMKIKRDLLLGIYSISKNQKTCLQLVGTGFRSWISHKKDHSVICLKVGFCDILSIEIPENIYVWLKEPTVIVIFGINNFLVGNFASRLKAARKLEFYKGTGVLTYNQKVLLKAGKKRV